MRQLATVHAVLARTALAAQVGCVVQLVRSYAPSGGRWNDQQNDRLTLRALVQHDRTNTDRCRAAWAAILTVGPRSNPCRSSPTVDLPIPLGCGGPLALASWSAWSS